MPSALASLRFECAKFFDIPLGFNGHWRDLSENRYFDFTHWISFHWCDLDFDYTRMIARYSLHIRVKSWKEDSFLAPRTRFLWSIQTFESDGKFNSWNFVCFVIQRWISFRFYRFWVKFALKSKIIKIGSNHTNGLFHFNKKFVSILPCKLLWDFARSKKVPTLTWLRGGPNLMLLKIIFNLTR